MAAVIVVLPSVGIGAEAKGLDAVGDEALVQELSRYGMDSLLDRYFATHQGSGSEQASVRAMMSIRMLLSSGQKLPAAQRQQIVQSIVDGADAIVPVLNDPNQLMQLATALITSAMERNANTIEYWGESPRSQAQLRPVAELVAKVLDLCSVRAKEKGEKLVEKFGNNPSPEQLKEYTALDKSGEYGTLHAFDGRPITVRCLYRPGIRSGHRLSMRRWRGLPSLIPPIARSSRLCGCVSASCRWSRVTTRRAKKVLLSVATNPQKQIEPAPDVLQQYEARYFMAVCDLLSRNADATAAAIAELSTWEDANLPQDPRVRDGAKAAMAMLSYRLDALAGAECN